MAELSNRIAFVTGASAGIGRAVVEDLVEQGARVVVNARRVEKLNALREELGESRVALAPGDASDPEILAKGLQTARQAFGAPADLVVVNAGRGLAGSVLTSKTTEWDEVIATNISGAAYLMRLASEQMLADIESRGDWLSHPHDIVVLGSTVGRHISPFSSMYGATKFAVNSLAEALRREVGPRGIRVSLIEPGIVKSEFQSVAGYDPEGFGQIMDKVGPVLVGEDIASLIRFIVSQPPRVAIGDVVIRATRQDYP